MNVFHLKYGHVYSQASLCYHVTPREKYKFCDWEKIPIKAIDVTMEHPKLANDYQAAKVRALEREIRGLLLQLNFLHLSPFPFSLLLI